MNSATHVVLVGYGPVGARFIEEILPAVRSGLVELTVVGAETAEAYNRVLIAEYAVGRTDLATMSMVDPGFASEDGARLLTGVRVTNIDRAAGTVALSSGESVRYDRLVLATGARANLPTLSGVERPGTDLPSLERGGPSLVGSDPGLPAGITMLRDVADADTVRASVSAGQRIVVLGAGVLGLEIAVAAAREGAEVCVVHHGSHPMARNLDRGGGTVLAQSLKRAGVSIVAHSRAEGVGFRTADDGSRHFDALLCADGKAIAGDLLLLSCGVSPRTELATLAGLPTSSGVLVDTDLSSWADSSIYAIGDCAHVAPRPASGSAPTVVPGGPTGLIGPGWRQAEWLAARLTAEATGAPVGNELSQERPSVLMLKAEDIDVVSAGRIDLELWDSEPPVAGVAARQVSQWVDAEHGRYVKMVTRSGVLEGMVCVGMPRTAAELTLLFERGGELPADRSVLLRHDGPDYSPSADSDAFAPESTVCWCNGVTVAHVHEAVAAGDSTVSCVGKSTRAGTGCGGCKGRIAELLERFAESPDPAGLPV